nr:hypothetical protein [Tanacetum cinerariifolium]
MSPRKFIDGDQKQLKSGVVINGPRPTPLKVKQESHSIHKQQHRQQIRPPIIIYTRSPEVIHTKPHEFMALVQKLTGHSGSKDQEQQHKKTLKQEVLDRNEHEFSNDSGVTNEKDKIMKAKSPMFNMPGKPYAGDIPLFTPNSIDYFCSPRRFFKVLAEHQNSMGGSSYPSQRIFASTNWRHLWDTLFNLPKCYKMPGLEPITLLNEGNSNQNTTKSIIEGHLSTLKELLKEPRNRELIKPMLLDFDDIQDVSDEEIEVNEKGKAEAGDEDL